MILFDSIFYLIKKVIKYKSIWILFPFTLVAFALVLVYLIIGCIYMLIDLMCRDLRNELERGNDKAGLLAIAFKYLIVYSVYISFEITRISIKLNMAILYFLAYCFFFVSSLFRIKETPFAFHTLED